MEQTQTKEENQYEDLLFKIEKAKGKRRQGFMYTGMNVTIAEEILQKLQLKGYTCQVEDFEDIKIYVWYF